VIKIDRGNALQPGQHAVQRVLVKVAKPHQNLESLAAFGTLDIQRLGDLLSRHHPGVK
jgi:hypothetical protein